MKKRIIIIIFTAAALVAIIALEKAYAYWIWTPETKKFVNPKNAVKDSPKEQFEWAMSFYQAKDYQKAAQEFEKLTKQYEYSEYASKSQYYVGLCYENMNKLYFAFQNYQKAIDNFPHIENMEEIIAREFNIANIFEDKASPKVLGTDIMTSTDRAVEIYRKVVDNAPFGRLADESLFRMGQAFKKAERYDEAIPSFQKILDDYPNSQFIDKAKFEVADCAYKASLKPAYDIESTDKAIKAFEDFSQTNRDGKLSGEAEKTVQRLKDKAAEKSFITAQFYESQRHYESAIIYYKDVVERFPESSIALKARSRIEYLSSRGSKNVQGAADTGDAGEKKGWQLFKFTKPVKKEKPADATVSKPEKPKAEKKPWAPFSFTKKSKPSEPKAVVKEEAENKTIEAEIVKEAIVETETKPAETVIAQEAVVQNSGTEAEPVNVQTPAENVTVPSEPVVVKEETKTPKKSWTPLSFPRSVKKEKPEKPKAEKKPWAPFSFTKKSKESEQPVVKEETKAPKKAWAPFSFPKSVKKEKADKPKAEKKPWAPLSFTKKSKEPEQPAVVKEEAPIQAETVPVSTEPAEAKPAEEEAQTVVVKESPVVQETVIIQDDVVIRKTQ